MLRMGTVLAAIAAGFLFGVPSASLQAGEMSDGSGLQQKHVETHPSQGDVREIEGAIATLATSEVGVFASIDTRELEPGHAYTLWFVAVNAPENCENAPCKASDVLKLSEATQSDVGYADGLIAAADGTGHFATFVPKGELRQAWIGNGLQKPQTAEIHLVLHHHGPVIPERVAEMIGSYRGACSDESLPEIVPATAKADGASGPNSCHLVQDVIFTQAGPQSAQK